jgi:hypothetical protein
MSNTMMTSFFSSKKKKQKTSHEAASLDGTDQHSNKNNNDDALQNQREGALKLPSTQPNESRLNAYLQEYAKTQLPRIDTNGNLRASTLWIVTERPVESSLKVGRRKCQGRTCAFQIDANIAHIIGKPARSRNWFVREALRLKVGDYVKQEMFPSDEFPAPFDREKHMEPIGEEYQRYSHAQWQGAYQQADSIDFHEAKMEGAASTLSHGGASTDSLEYVYSPGDDDPAPTNGMEVLQSGDGVEVLMAFQTAHWQTRTLIEA